jgi:hypothetical protein
VRKREIETTRLQECLRLILLSFFLCRGLIAHYLQVKIREHIILHGDVRAKVEKTVAGHTFEVEGFRDEGDDDAEAVSESKLDRRNSFQLIAARLEKKGEQVKLGRKGEMGDDDSEMGDSMKNPAMAGMPINPMPGITAVQGVSKLNLFVSALCVCVNYQLTDRLRYS